MSLKLSVWLSASALVISVVALVAAFVALGEQATLPTKDEPGAYTQAVVDDAIRRYERTGFEATVAYYDDPANVDGEWYVYILDLQGNYIAHPNPDTRAWTYEEQFDATEYFIGDDLLSATEEGRWIHYTWYSPTSGEAGQKHSWVVLHDDMVFGCGWYEN